MKRFVKAELKEKDSHIVVYTDESGTKYEFSGGTWAWRNHNPGNVRPGMVSKRNGAIGFVTVDEKRFAVFPDDESGRRSLVDSLRTYYMKNNIDEIVHAYAPKGDGDNDEEKYRKFLRRRIGIKDNRKLREFTSEEFEKLRKGIEVMEGYKKGIISKVPIKKTITQVKKDHHGIICTYYIETVGWLSKEDAINLAKQGKVDAVVCMSRTGNIFLRSRPDKSLSDNFGNLVEK